MRLNENNRKKKRNHYLNDKVEDWSEDTILVAKVVVIEGFRRFLRSNDIHTLGHYLQALFKGQRHRELVIVLYYLFMLVIFLFIMKSFL